MTEAEPGGEKRAEAEIVAEQIDLKFKEYNDDESGDPQLQSKREQELFVLLDQLAQLNPKHQLLELIDWADVLPRYASYLQSKSKKN